MTTNLFKPAYNILARVRDFKRLQKLDMPMLLEVLIIREFEKDMKLKIRTRNEVTATTNGIVIEGLDGAGKATISVALKELLTKVRREVEIISYPAYDHWSSFLVKMYLSGKFGKDPNKIKPKVASFFYAFDRYIHYHQVVKPLKKKGKFIIYDRYTTSNIFFQGSKLMNNEKHNLNALAAVTENSKWLLCLEHVFFGIPYYPDVFFLNFEKEDYIEQVLSTKFENKFGDDKDIHENSEFLLNTLSNSEVICDLLKFYKITMCKDHTRRTPEELAIIICSLI